MALVLMIASIIFFIAGYVFYGRYVANRFDIDPSRETPAHKLNDGIDYEPARKLELMGHHFASIAGAAPIIGPITAAVYGWVPVFGWIVLGGIFIGAVHDFSSLMASVRHQGKSIGKIIEDEIGSVGKFFFLVFSWTTLVLVVAVFSVIVAKTFVEVPHAATASVLFLIIAVVWGAIPKKNIAIATVIGVVLMAGAILVGVKLPISLSFDSWLTVLFGYIFLAAILPVGLLLRPRDYLNAYLLFGALVLALVGIIVARPAIQSPAFSSFNVPNFGPMFPILFVTVACGAISGFHSLVASGTVAKQLSNEKHAKAIGFGSMLLESFLAVIALIAAITFTRPEYLQILKDGGPVTLFSRGVGGFAASIGIPEGVAVTFLSLAVSAFALTSLDTATRIGRFMFQEFFARPGRPSLLSRSRYISTAVTVCAAGLLAYTGSYAAIWPIFGSANQLLAALALLTITIWLINRGKRAMFVLIPMLFMMVVTLSALATLMYTNFTRTHNWILGGMGAVLFGVAVYLAICAWLHIRKLKGVS